MIKSIFYSKFDVHEGPKVVHQVPADSISPSPTSTITPLIHFPTISTLVIPRQSFASLPVTLLLPPHRILSHPIALYSPHYPRNEFLFAFSLLLSASTPPQPYAIVVSKLASLFRQLEESSHFLSEDPSAPNTGKIYALCEILLEDLNNYCEAMIPIDEHNTLNIKLFPTYAPPPSLLPNHVPLATVQLQKLTDPNWDLTMLRILPFVNGVNSVRQIAMLADADYRLVRKAISHLLYYGCVILLDVFNFGATYAATAEMPSFVRDGEMQDECRRYVLAPGASGAAAEGIDGTRLVELYASLRQGQSLKEWCMLNAEVVGVIDVRRWITFGVIKGFLYRVHKYALATNARAEESFGNESNGVVVNGKRGKGGKLSAEDKEFSKYLDGTHCFDEICTELGLSERNLVQKLKAWGDVAIIQR